VREDLNLDATGRAWKEADLRERLAVGRVPRAALKEGRQRLPAQRGASRVSELAPATMRQASEEAYSRIASSAREDVLQPSCIDSTVEPGVEICRAGRQHALPGGAVHSEPASHEQA